MILINSIILLFGVMFNSSLEDVIDGGLHEVAHYLLHGNVNDHLQKYHSQGYNTQPTINRFGYDNSAIHFSGDTRLNLSTDWRNTDEINEFSITLWIYKEVELDSNILFSTPYHIQQSVNTVVIKLNQYIFPNTNQYFYSLSEQINMNQWYHIGVAISSNQIKYFLNGSPIYQGSRVEEPFYLCKDMLVIGQSVSSFVKYNQSTDNFQGSISDIRIFKGYIANTQVQEIYEIESEPCKNNCKLCNNPMDSCEQTTCEQKDFSQCECINGYFKVENNDLCSKCPYGCENCSRDGECQIYDSDNLNLISSNAIFQPGIFLEADANYCQFNNADQFLISTDGYGNIINFNLQLQGAYTKYEYSEPVYQAVKKGNLMFFNRINKPIELFDGEFRFKTRFENDLNTEYISQIYGFNKILIAVYLDKFFIGDSYNIKQNTITIEGIKSIKADFFNHIENFYTLSKENKIRVWSGQFQEIYQIQHTQIIEWVDLSSDDDEFVLVDVTFSIYIYNAYDGELKYKNLHIHTEKINMVQFSHNRGYIVTVSNDGTTKVWNQDLNLLFKYKHNGSINYASFSKNNDLLCIAGQQQLLEMFRIHSNLCPDGEYQWGSKCYTCQAQCSTCNGSQGCNMCLNNLDPNRSLPSCNCNDNYEALNSSTMCQPIQPPNCHEGEYASEGLCHQCDTTCATCEIFPTNCIVYCPTNCLRCLSETGECIECQKNYMLQYGNCYQIKAYDDQITGGDDVLMIEFTVVIIIGSVFFVISMVFCCYFIKKRRNKKQKQKQDQYQDKDTFSQKNTDIKEDQKQQDIQLDQQINYNYPEQTVNQNQNFYNYPEQTVQQQQNQNQNNDQVYNEKTEAVEENDQLNSKNYLKESNDPQLIKQNLKSLEEFQKLYEILEKIGQGQFGEVFKIIEKSTKKHMAVKQLLTRELEENKLIQREISLFQKFKDQQNSNIIMAKDFYYTVSQNTGFLGAPTYQYLIVMELAKYNLKQQMVIKKQNKQQSTDKETCDLLKQLISGLQFLENTGINHRDIKPENILVMEDNTYKLTDFGISKDYHMTTMGRNTLSNAMGTPIYMSPEMYEKLINANQEIQNKPLNYSLSDVFSLGLTILQFLLNLENVEILGMNQRVGGEILIAQKIIQVKNEKLKEILQNMLQFDISKRMTFGVLSLSVQDL